MTRTERGVTLLELLIAVSLMAFLSLGVLYSMRVGIDALDKTTSRFRGNRRVLGVDKALAAQVGGLLPVTVDCIGEGGGKAVMFHGDPQSMRFVTSYSLEEGARGYPKLLELTVIPGAEGRGYRLVVNERPWAGPFSLRGVCVGMRSNPELGQSGPRFVPIATGPGSFVLADRLAAVRFLYRETLPAPIFERWTPVWIANKLPTAIRIEMAPLDEPGAGLRVLTSTFPIRITANPMYLYAD